MVYSSTNKGWISIFLNNGRHSNYSPKFAVTWQWPQQLHPDQFLQVRDHVWVWTKPSEPSWADLTGYPRPDPVPRVVCCWQCSIRWPRVESKGKHSKDYEQKWHRHPVKLNFCWFWRHGTFRYWNHRYPPYVLPKITRSVTSKGEGWTQILNKKLNFATTPLN